MFRDIDADKIWLTPALEPAGQTVLVLPRGVYGAAFAPDGQTVTYAASAGLKLGSEIGHLNLQSGEHSVLHTFPKQIVSFPEWSPDGNHLAYILMPDSNIPFTVGELWLSDPTTGAPAILLAEADAGHGFPPAWSPDSQSLVYVHRENPNNPPANRSFDALASNLYEANINTGSVTPLTSFEAEQVYDTVWSPDGSQLAFTAGDAVWLLEPGSDPVQISMETTARHPTWLMTPPTE